MCVCVFGEWDEGTGCLRVLVEAEMATPWVWTCCKER